MVSQAPLEMMLGPARLAPYLDEAGGDKDKASDLYLWATDLAGALHPTIAFVEIAVRNAISRELVEWNPKQGPGYGPDWALPGGAATLLYDLVGAKKLRFAQSSAKEEANRRPRNHARYRAEVTNDDVIAQLMFGTWSRLIAPVSGLGAKQSQLWVEGVSRAFPFADQDEVGRRSLGAQLERIRSLRNRVAHHDNLLGVEVSRRLNDVLSILRKIDPGFPEIAMAKSRVRSVVRQDPRRRW